jgi:hypothetical protein
MKQNGAGRDRARHSKTALDAASVQAPPDAPFAAVGIEPLDAPMWPVQTSAWFQAERGPAVPAWSGVHLERRNRVTWSDFWRAEIGPVNRGVGQVPVVPDALGRPEAYPTVPESGLAPLGWDPRAVHGREERA